MLNSGVLSRVRWSRAQTSMRMPIEATLNLRAAAVSAPFPIAGFGTNMVRGLCIQHSGPAKAQPYLDPDEIRPHSRARRPRYGRCEPLNGMNLESLSRNGPTTSRGELSIETERRIK